MAIIKLKHKMRVKFALKHWEVSFSGSNAVESSHKTAKEAYNSAKEWLKEHGGGTIKLFDVKGDYLRSQTIQPSTQPLNLFDL